MLREIFEYTVSLYSISDNAIYNNLIIICICGIAYRVSYSIVGKIYRIGLISGRMSGKILHWSIRIIVCYVLYKVIKVVNEIYELIVQGTVYSWLIIMMINLLLVIVLTIILVVRKNIRKC